MRRAAPMLLAALLLAGCTFPGFGSPDESGADPDPHAGFDGPGVLLVARNDGSYPMTVRWTLLDEQGANVGSTSLVLQPGVEGERRLPFPEVGRYDVLLQYNWTGDGRASSGLDRQALHSSQCPDLMRLAWSLRATPQGQGGAAFLERACAS